MVTKPKYSWINNFAEFVVAKRWYILAASLLLVMGLGSGAQHLTFNNDYRVFFGEDNPQLKAFDDMQATYTKDDNIFIVLAPKDGNVFTKKTLAAIEKFTEKSWQVPFSSRVDALTNYQHTYSEEDDLYVENLVEDASSLTQADLSRIREIALNEQLLVHRLISDDGDVTGINITLKLPGEKFGEEKASVEAARALVAELRAENPEIDTYLTGNVMLSNAFGEAAQLDSQTLLPAMFGVVFITILLSTRSIVGMIATFLVLVFSIASAMGAAGWMGVVLSAPVMSAPTMILTLAVADSIHILITLFQYMRKGNDKYESIKESIRVNFMPVFITSLTTVIGFLTMNFSDVPPFHDLGNITAMGIASAFLFSIFTLPAVVAVLPLRVKAVSDEAEKATLLGKLAESVIANRKAMLWGTTIVVLVVTSMITQNALNEQFVNYFDERIEFRRDTDFLNENLTGIYSLQFSLGSGDAGAINNPEYLKKVEEFKTFYEKQEGVVHVNAFTEVAKRINKSMHGDTAKYYAIPENRNEAAQYLLLYEMSLPYGLDLNNQMDVDKSATRFTVTTKNLPSVEIIELSTKGEDWLRANAPEYMYSDASSPAVMFSHITQRQIYSMIEGNIWAIVLITLVMIFAISSLKFGLLSVIPNVLPIAAGFGLWGILVGEIDSALAMVFGMTLGIVVDDSVHFLSKYMRAIRENGMSPEDAIRYAFNTVGKAIVVTTIVLTIGFMVLGQSSFKMNSGMAQLTSLTIVLALIIDFLLLPALLLAVTKKSQHTDSKTTLAQG